MAISIFDLFTVGIGPSSSHTVGPMRAARRFALALDDAGLLEQLARIQVELCGSLGATGKGHGTDKAVLLGLEGSEPETADPDTLDPRIAAIHQSRSLAVLGERSISFNPRSDLAFRGRKRMPLHSNGMVFEAFDEAGNLLLSKVYYSVGGGFVVAGDAETPTLVEDRTPLPYPYDSATALLERGQAEGLTFAQMVLANEKCWRDEATIRREVLHLWDVMRACVRRATQREGLLPGSLRVSRRAPRLYAELQARRTPHAAANTAVRASISDLDPLSIMDWINFYALAVSEENATGGQVVTAPTNGAAGIIPAVLHYYAFHTPNPSEEGVVTFMLTAGAVGILFKQGASISGAEVGCQGEVGVACSMASAGLVAALGGGNIQIENAAEIGMEHNLGLTCDPVGGLVQIPCIERNAMGAVKALNAARLAMQGDGCHKVSLDKVIETMRQTGADMKTKYKETSRGGLAINVIEC